MSAPPRVLRAFLLSAALFALNVACGVEEKRSGLPASAQSSIDNITSDMSRADYEKIYAEAAEEWRQTASADESRARLERVRNALGNVLSRAQLSAPERARATAGPRGRGPRASRPRPHRARQRAQPRPTQRAGTRARERQSRRPHARRPLQHPAPAGPPPP